ncbi:alpha/beta hydrolase [Bacillus sp. 1P06AnD]|uniref:alpha/beta hydrolase n=1 Tax=Bacillus sp. 1P06AnD TaxID=3132208 RepID=UPI00399FF027
MCHLYRFSQKDNVQLTARVYPLATDKPAILYVHGGGLLYGSKDDLPEPYIQAFLAAGYPFVAFDYRLAPEVALPDIYSDIQDAIKWFSNHCREIGLSHSRFIYFGRSAGSYLTFLAANDPSLPKPEKMLSFYGYHRLDFKEFTAPGYQHAISVPKRLIDCLVEKEPLVDGPIQKRFALYIYARQSGTWIQELLQGSFQKIDAYQLKESDLQALPPVFIAQSREDQDVPFYVGEMLHDKIPINEFYIVEKGEHDFDRDPSNKIASEAYRRAIAFCDSKA